MTTTAPTTAGLPPAPRVLRAPEVVILNFHGVGTPARKLDPGEADVWLTSDAFRAALDETDGRTDVEFTFDDGNESDVRDVLPELLARGRTATFFVPSALVGRPGRVTARDLADLVAAGMRIGTHGMRHRPWIGLSPDEMDDEIRVSRDVLEQAAGVRIDAAACPFGAYDRRTLAALRAARYSRVLTSDRGRAPLAAWLQPRNTVHRTDTSADVRALVTRRPGLVAKAANAARLAVKRWRTVRSRPDGRTLRVEFGT